MAGGQQTRLLSEAQKGHKALLTVSANPNNNRATMDDFIVVAEGGQRRSSGGAERARWFGAGSAREECGWRRSCRNHGLRGTR